MVQVDDPLVGLVLDGTALRLPLSHDLPLILSTHPEYARAIGRIASILKKKYSDMTAIDVGANVGDTVALLRGQDSFPILCVEGSAEYFRLLERNVGQLPEVEVTEALLDEVSGPLAGTVVSMGGTARVERSVGNHALTAVSLPDLLRHHPRFLHPRLIKVDTDGMDARIIRGSIPVLRTERPVLFFEYVPDLAASANADARRLLKELCDLGYHMMMVYENTGDYVGSIDLANADEVDDLDAFYTGRGADRYADLCVFHSDDDDVWQRVRAAELAHFRRARLGSSG